MRPTRTPCCSRSPIARCSKSSTCSARTAGMRDRMHVNSEERKKRVAQRLNGHAYLLLEVLPGTSDRVAKTLAESSAVPYAAAVWGPWDVVARVTLGNLNELLKFVDE